MALRQIISKAIFPTLTQDLKGSIATQVATVPEMVDSMLAPQVFAYTPSPATSGAFKTTGTVQEPAGKKVYYDVEKEGLFADKRTSFHA